MTYWRATKSLTRFRKLVDERWPDRYHASDGTIGDLAHQAETSGHNADDTAGSKPEWDGDPDTTPEVRAFDMDADLREPGTTAQMLVDHLVRLPGLDEVFRYIIFDRKIYRAADGWKPEPYTGPNPHTVHIHFSGAYTQAADDNETFDFRLDEVGDMPLSSDDAIKVWNTDTAVPMPSWRADKQSNPTIMGASAMVIAMDEAHAANIGVAALKTQLSALGSSLTAAIGALAAKDAVDEVALGEALAPAVAAAVLAGLPDTTDPISQEEVTTAVKAAFAGAFGPASA